jgi:signal transduction histidine kinase
VKKIRKHFKGIERRWIMNNVSAVIFLAVFAVLTFAVSFGIYSYSNVRIGLEQKARTTTDFFGNYISQSYNEYYQSCIKFAQTFEEKNTLELQFISTNGKIVASSYGPWAGQSPETSDVAKAIATRTTSHFRGRNPRTGERILAVSHPMIYANGEVIGVLRYVTSLKNVDRQVWAAIGIAMLIGVIFIAYVLNSSRFFLRSILEPVSEITATARRIADGSYGARIQKKFDDEIGALADTVNDMSAKISQAERMQTEFISSVSHELRTPLTAIAGWGETLLSADEMDPGEVRRGVGIILREARRLTGMVEELLEFTRMQDGRFTLNVEPSDILSEFEDTVFMYGSRLRQEGIELEYLDSDEIVPEIPCDVARLRQVFLNILDNAAKHGGEGKRITASIGVEDGDVVIRIRDFGPGIPEEELPHVKRKFYKGSSKARGSGIGLAVCEEIVSMHGGVMTLSNAEGGGTLVTISLPTGEE